MSLLEEIVARAKADKQRIVLPEAEEERTLKAADHVLADDIADIILIGNPDHIKQEAEEWGLKNIDKATIIDPLHFDKTEEYAEKLKGFEASAVTQELNRELARAGKSGVTEEAVAVMLKSKSSSVLGRDAASKTPFAARAERKRRRPYAAGWHGRRHGRPASDAFSSPRQSRRIRAILIGFG